MFENIIMKKTLSISDILLFTISGVLDFFQEIKDSGNIISNYYQNFYGFVPLKWEKIYLKKAINRNLRLKYITFKKSDFKLTRRGEEKLLKNFPLFYFSKKLTTSWDGIWWVIVFDIKEIKRHYRDYLRRLLKKLNIKMLQKSVWITPHKEICFYVYQFLKERKLEGQILIFQGQFLSKKVNSHIIKKIWNLNLLNNKYRLIYLKLTRDYRNYLESGDIQLLKNSYIVAKKKTFELLNEDPFFPKKFLPKPWYYSKILEILKLIWIEIEPKNK